MDSDQGRYQVHQTESSDIDPRLQESLQVSQSYSNLPPPSFAPSPNLPRLPPPPQSHPHHHYAPPPQWPQDSYNAYYGAPSDQQHSPINYQINHGTPVPPTQQSDGDLNSGESKRPRACEACRGLKVRCEPDPGDGPCKRCAKAGRHCMITAPSRKRQKKTDSRVAELERRIEALTADVHARKEGGASGSDGGTYEEGDTSHLSSAGRRPSQSSPYANMAGAGQKRNISEYQSDSYPPMSYNPAMNTPGMSSEPHPHYIPGAGIPSAEHPRVTGPIVLGDADVVGRGLLHADTANELFNHYTNHMTRQMPIVVLPNDSSSEYMRNAKPVLFLAILSVASVHDLQAKLTKEITRLLADHVTVNGEKSLELLQALLVITTWYWPATNGNSNYFHFVHMAAVMAKDLGIDRSSAFKKDQNFDFLNTNHSLSDKGTVECRRAWLGCYVLCSSLAMGLRQPSLIQFDAYTQDCVDILRTSTDALLSDIVLCRWVQLQRIADEFVAEIPPDETTGISGAKLRSAYKEFDRQTKDWEKQNVAQIYSLPLSLTLHVINLYMHELAMNHDSGLESGKPSRNRGKTQPQPIMSTSAAFPSTSITSALGILDIFTTSGVHELRTLPVFQFSQVAHATVSLIKTYFAIFSGSEADQGQSVSTELVDKRFNGLVESLRAAAANDKSPPAQTFLMVVMSLRSWYERKRQATAGFMSGEGNDTQGPTSSPQSRKTQRSGEDSDRALHLLSEVAMGKSNNSNYSHKDGLNVQKSAQDALGLADSGEALKDDALSKVMRMLNNMDWGRISSTLQSS